MSVSSYQTNECASEQLVLSTQLPCSEERKDDYCMYERIQGACGREPSYCVVGVGVGVNERRTTIGRDCRVGWESSNESCLLECLG